MTYDYECKDESCAERQEVKHGMNETPDVHCGKCGGECKRIILRTPKFTKNPWKNPSDH